MTQDEAVAALRLFNERFDEVLQCGFTQWVTENKIRFSVSGHESGELGVTVDVPDLDKVKAITTTVRAFVLNGDKMSLAVLADAYEVLPIEDAAREHYGQARGAYRQYLNGTGPIKINMGGEDITPQCVWDVFVYGHIMHLDLDQRATYRQWMEDETKSKLMQFMFCNTLIELMKVAGYISQLNAYILQYLQQKTALPGTCA